MKKWAILLLLSLAGNAFQLVADWNVRQQDETMRLAIASSVWTIQSDAEMDLRVAFVLSDTCPPVDWTMKKPIPPGIQGLRAIPCKWSATMASDGAALMIRTRRMLQASLSGEKLSEYGGGEKEDLVYVNRLQRALKAQATGKKDNLDDIERKLLTQIESGNQERARDWQLRGEK